MERRQQQLNLNAPLLSVRRYSSPLHSSELIKTPRQQPQSPTLNKPEPCDDEEVTKPASVPFQWEQIPGRPKIESRRLSDAVRFVSGEIPKPPPGRLSSGPSRFASGDQNLVLYSPRVEPFSVTDHASLVEKLKESLRCEDDWESEDEDAYSDALDKLSCSESQSLNCSVSGSMGMKRLGRFSVDVETRELMLSRFLPAAKAAVLETPPQYDVKKKKEPSVTEKPVKKVVSGNIEKPLVSKFSSELYHSRQYISTDQESEDEDRDKEHPSSVKKSSKRWGIIPRFCVKSSLCLLNPLPGFRSKPKAQTPSTGEVRRLTRNALSGPLDKIACPVPHKKKFHSGLLSREISSMENKLSKEPDQFSKSRDSYSSAASSPLRRYRSGNLSPHLNKVPKSLIPLPKEVGGYYNDSKLASSRKFFMALTDVSKNQKTEKRLSGRILGNADEKTPYVDAYSVHKSKHFPISKPFLPKPGEAKTLEADEVGSEVQRVMKEERRVESREIIVKSHLAPLLPKSPSESWLWRTGTPCVHSSRTSPVRSKDLKGSKADAKWENIVKSSNVHRDRVHYSQELTPHRPSQRQANHGVRGTIKN